MIIWKGYAWDGASGPTYDDKRNMRGSLLHDVFYQLMRQGHLGSEYREIVDKIFYITCLEDGMNKIRAKYYYWCVRKFACSSANPKNVKQIHDAP